jgi:hypothetical protein
MVNRVTRVSEGILEFESSVERRVAPTLNLTARIADNVIDAVLPDERSYAQVVVTSTPDTTTTTATTDDDVKPQSEIVAALPTSPVQLRTAELNEALAKVPPPPCPQCYSRRAPPHRKSSTK